MDTSTADKQQENISFEYLPLHIITNILSYLPISDLLNACLTNKSWFEASLHKDLLKKVVFTFKNCSFTQSDEQFIEIMYGTRYFPNLNLDTVQFNGDCDKFWIRFGKYIVDIKIDSCKIDQNKFFHILQFLPNLKRLEIFYTNKAITDITLFDNKTEIEKNKIIKCLSCIDTLEFHRLVNITDEIFERFISFTNNIKSFKLLNCCEIIDPSTVVKFCKKNAESLINLDIRWENFDQEQYIAGLAELRNLKLKELSIEINCSDERIDVFFMNQINLETLYIENLNNQTMTSVCKHLKNLKHLETTSSFDVSDSLAYINNLNKIEVLRLSRVKKTSDRLLCEMIKDKKPKLRELKFSLPITNDFLLNISDNCPNLEVLDLRFRDQIPKRGAQMIFKKLTKLRSLRFGPYDDGDVDGDVDDDDGGDDDLRIDNDQRIDSDLEDNEFICSISNLEKLKHLYLKDVAPFYGLTVTDIAKLKNLTTLTIGSPFELKKEDFRHLAIHLKNIEIISLEYSILMSDEIIKFITKQWKNLKSLSLGNCWKLTEQSLICIAENCKNIKELYLIGYNSKNNNPIYIVRKLQNRQ